ncbi:MAG TPA: EAL domain-containing protein [Candidatus Omnitrophota bacterium]|nr:EAL domain-containing protein [Candidatus Omnitrophota bacterium]
MERELRILIVEDVPADAELMERELRKAGIVFSFRCVQAEGAFREALCDFSPDIILSDYNLPAFDGMRALRIVQELGLKIPFIIVTGSINEETAASCIKAGADDYLLKERLTRIGVAVRSALDKKRVYEEKKHAEEALRLSEERYALACCASNDGLWDWDLRTNEIYFSPRWKSMLGYAENEIGKDEDEWFRRVHSEDVEYLKSDIALHFEGLASHLANEHRIAHKDGTYRWVLSRGIAVRDDTGKIYRMVGSQSDITERKRAEEQLLHNAFYDALTGLPNRALFMDRLERSAARAKRDSYFKFAVLLLDLDRFKLLNDSLGHLAGDQLLIGVAQRLSEYLGPGDTMAHLGGDDFAILKDDIRGMGETLRFTNFIQKKLEAPFHLSGEEVVTAASIGIAFSTETNRNTEEILRNAEIAMYRAKALGKGRYEIFDVDMHTHAVGLQKLEADLRRALERRELRVYYQPVVSLCSGKITGFECLVRWQHPERGLIAPSEFISVAEETGLIVPLGEFILKTACEESRNWKLPGGTALFSLAVNFSAVQFQFKGLVPSIKKTLKETARSPETLNIEITESIAMSNHHSTLKTLKDLHELGVHILIDDFGTGYSSLVSLKRFPISALKIDCSFVAGLPDDSENSAITTTIIAMAQSLRLQVIAEGVESRDQLMFLRSLQCDEVQGFLFGRPVPAGEIPEVLARENSLSEMLNAE